MVPGCGVRISSEGHHCSLHADCWLVEGFDPQACEVCSPCVLELQEATPEARNSVDSSALLRKAWMRARKRCVKRGLEVTWRNPVLGTSQAIMRQRTVSTESNNRAFYFSGLGIGGRCPIAFLHPSSCHRTTILSFFLLGP
ncbi:hypothetical protein Pcinc_028207 [Petrolisthes cinctipes]|uniref:Uncharacterized protein n=1 Tax=Petrolisthes cinctipes TaxID=88211 RepID=A0AAE1K987_PETCI|nr:hypothetical protein Pcinc_028207 [Petrolisthes cinctipes]